MHRDYYHCFLGNGLDAVLIGPTGSMVSDKVGPDRCYWYKSGCYYPENKLVRVVPSRFPAGRPLEHAPGSGWYELAPLGRTWYQICLDGQPLALQASSQQLAPREGTLYSSLDYGVVKASVVTFLHATRSLLVERYEFDRPVEFTGSMAPGPWVEEDWDTDPFIAVSTSPDAPESRYDLGETHGVMALRLEPGATCHGLNGLEHRLTVQSRSIVKYFYIADNRQDPLDTEPLDQAIALGFDRLRQEHLAFWQEYFSPPQRPAISQPQGESPRRVNPGISIPDRQFQQFYDASMYHFKASQNPASGGLPVNNLRATWSSHLFWDSYFIQRALLEANHRAEALEACRFLQRTLDSARRNAQEESSSEGLKWDWEITHEGRRAYGAWTHMRDQVHNNASYANEIWQYYEFTRDRERLLEFYPILQGLARFFLKSVICRTQRGWETREVIGVSESPIRIKNEGITLAGSIAILKHSADAARILAIESEFTHKCDEVATGLIETLQRLYNGRYFASAEGSESMNMSSLAPFYPMQVLTFDDPRCLQTALAYLEHQRAKAFGPTGDLNSSAWTAGLLAMVFARLGDADTAWSLIESTRPSLCVHGGMAEVTREGRWNMQYFSTAQGAVCTAIHNLLLQAQEDEIRLFPAVPSTWEQCSFEGLLAAGCEVTARYNRSSGTVEATARNITDGAITRRIRVGPLQLGTDNQEMIAIAPGAYRTLRVPV